MSFGTVNVKLEAGVLIVKASRPIQADAVNTTGKSVNLIDPNQRYSLPDGSSVRVICCALNGWGRGQIVGGGRFESNRRRF